VVRRIVTLALNPRLAAVQSDLHTPYLPSTTGIGVASEFIACVTIFDGEELFVAG